MPKHTARKPLGGRPPDLTKAEIARRTELYCLIAETWKVGGLPAAKQHLTAGFEYTPSLLAAASVGRPRELLQQLLVAGADGSAALCDAICDKDSMAVEQLIGAGADVSGTSVSAADKEGRTLLHGAALWGHQAAVELLLAAGASVTAADKQGRTPLHDAAARGRPAAVQLLLAAGASVAAADKEGRTPLHDAAAGGYGEAVALLLAAGASVSAADKEGRMPVHTAAAPTTLQPARAAELLLASLLAAGASVPAADRQGRTPLHDAAAQGETAAVTALLAAGSSVAAADNEGRTPLHEAAARGDQEPLQKRLRREEVAQLLLGAGAGAWVTDTAGCTPLLLAAKQGRSSLVTTLLAASRRPLQAGHIAAAQQAADGAGHAYTAGLLAAALATCKGEEAAAAGCAAEGPSAQQQVQTQHLQQQEPQQQQQQPEQGPGEQEAHAACQEDTAAQLAGALEVHSRQQQRHQQQEKVASADSIEGDDEGQAEHPAKRMRTAKGQQGVLPQLSRPQQQQPREQREQQEQQATGTLSSIAAAAAFDNSSRTAAILKGIKAEGAAAADHRTSSNRGRLQQQQQVAGGSSVLGRAAAALLKGHLQKKLLPGLPNEQQLQYYQLADESFNGAKLVRLHSSYLAPKTVRNAAASSSHKTRRAAKSTRAEQQFPPELAHGLLRLRDAVHVFKHTTSTAAIPAAAVPQNPAASKLLLALRCFHEWEGRMVQQQEPPLLLQLLLLGKLQGGGGEGDVVEIIDLAEEEDREEERQRQQKLFEESGADCVVVHVKHGLSATQDAAASGSGAAVATVKREQEW